jgi:hypothetical protein
MASNGYSVSFSSISRFDYYRSASGATNGLLQYQIGSGAFSDITNINYFGVSTGQTNAPFDLTGISALQNVGANTNVTFRIVNYGGTSSAGNWYIYNTGGTTAPDLAVQGTVTQILTTNAPAGAPVFSSVTFTNSRFQFTVTGTPGTNYIVLAATNLTSPVWVPLQTNPAPFVFVETNGNFPARFYRSLVAP